MLGVDHLIRSVRRAYLLLYTVQYDGLFIDTILSRCQLLATVLSIAKDSRLITVHFGATERNDYHRTDFAAKNKASLEMGHICF